VVPHRLWHCGAAHQPLGVGELGWVNPMNEKGRCNQHRQILKAGSGLFSDLKNRVGRDEIGRGGFVVYQVRSAAVTCSVPVLKEDFVGRDLEI